MVSSDASRDRSMGSRVLGAVDLVSATLLGVGVFGGLPARVFHVDVLALGLCVLLTLSGVSLVLGWARALTVVRWAAYAQLGLGLVTATALSLSWAYLAAIYGPVGKGGSIIFALLVALVAPYGIGLPMVKLVLVGRAPKP